MTTVLLKPVSEVRASAVEELTSSFPVRLGRECRSRGFLALT